MDAYNYQTQKWVTGKAGTLLRLSQLNQELDLLTGPRGEEYSRFHDRSRLTHAEQIRQCQKGITECEAALFANLHGGK